MGGLVGSSSYRSFGTFFVSDSIVEFDSIPMLICLTQVWMRSDPHCLSLSTTTKRSREIQLNLSLCSLLYPNWWSVLLSFLCRPFFPFFLLSAIHAYIPTHLLAPNSTTNKRNNTTTINNNTTERDNITRSSGEGNTPRGGLPIEKQAFEVVQTLQLDKGGAIAPFGPKLPHFSIPYEFLSHCLICLSLILFLLVVLLFPKFPPVVSSRCWTRSTNVRKRGIQSTTNTPHTIQTPTRRHADTY